MADKKEYYYLKLKEGFFESDDLKLLQSLKDGYLYSDILMKLYLKSLRAEGRLMYRGIIPYTPEMIATVTGHQVGTVEKAIGYFKQMGFIEILDNGAIYMMDIQNFIGKSSSEADRKREYRTRIDNEKSTIKGLESGQMSGQISGQMSGQCPPEIRDKSLETRDESLEDRDKSTEVITVSKDTVCMADAQRVADAWNSLGLAQISRLATTSKRYGNLKARISEYGIEDVLRAVENIKESTFLRGQNKSGWIITFDWFVKPNNFTKVLEGQYKNSVPSGSNGGVAEYMESTAGWYQR